MKERLQNFRQSLYSLFEKRADSLFNLLDALCRDGHKCKSVVELSQSASFEREYSSITDAICNGLSQVDYKKIETLVFSLTKAPSQKPHLFFTDCTANPRPYAKTLLQRGITHAPNPAPGNKPICVGHQYSLLAMAPNGERSPKGNWLIPLTMKRVPIDDKGNELGMKQMVDSIDELEIDNELCLHTGDSLYGSETCRQTAVKKKNLVHQFRLSNNRKLFQQPRHVEKQGPGRKKWFGDKVLLSDESTHPEPGWVQSIPITTAQGKEFQVELTLFKNLLLRGSKKFASQNHPINVVRAIVKDSQGSQVFKRPLWIGLVGEQRDEITPEAAYQAYRNRYDIEHFFRFGKQKLLLDSYQTPELEHEQDWWQFVPLAYIQLYLANRLASLLPKPWERYLPAYKEPQEQEKVEKTPTQVQRSFASILEHVGTPANPPKPRGNPMGRKPGTTINKRQTTPIIFKSSGEQCETKKSNSSTSENQPVFPNKIDIESILAKLKTDLKKLGLSEKEFVERFISSG